MTRQEMFNKAYLGILSQGRQSKQADSDSCAYRGEDGCKCAVGWLIDDDELATQWDSINNNDTSIEGVYNLVAYGQMVAPDWLTEEELPFLSDLQYVHDYPTNNSTSTINQLEPTVPDNFIDKFKQAAQLFAEKYNLTVPELPVQA